MIAVTKPMLAPRSLPHGCVDRPKVNDCDSCGARALSVCGSVADHDLERLGALAEVVKLAAGAVLTREGEMPDHIYFVLDGEVDIRKGGRKINVDPGLFIGEIAFLTNKPATATVTVARDALYYAWPRGALQLARDKDNDLAGAIGTVLNMDMAGKLART